MRDRLVQMVTQKVLILILRCRIRFPARRILLCFGVLFSVGLMSDDLRFPADG
jgi:hypothetical protein